jgi:RNA polymerase sigma factor (sigma-70 family)
VADRATRRRFRAGDSEAVRAVYREYGRLVYAVAARALGDPGLAEEVVQQTFVKAWRAAADVDDSRELGPWLAAIARRTAIDVYRRESRQAAIALETVPEGESGLVAPPVSADALHDTWEVRRAVDDLPADEREVVRLQHFEGLTHAQISERLGVAVGTIKSRSHRAHRRLTAALGYLRETDGQSLP